LPPSLPVLSLIRLTAPPAIYTLSLHDALPIYAQLLLALEALARARDLARAHRVHDDERITRRRHAGDAEHLHRDARARRRDLLAALVQQCAHLAIVVAAHERIADVQRAVRDEHGRERALAHV